jgi:hypothetical protein
MINEKEIHQNVLQDIKEWESYMILKYPDYALPDFRRLYNDNQFNQQCCDSAASVNELMKKKVDKHRNR